MWTINIIIQLPVIKIRIKVRETYLDSFKLYNFIHNFKKNLLSMSFIKYLRSKLSFNEN